MTIISENRPNHKMTPLSSVIKSLIFLLVIFSVTHLLKFPGSIAYLREIIGSQPILDMQPSFSSDESYHRLESFGELGRQMYLRTILTIDVIFPISAFIFLFILSKFTIWRIGAKPIIGKALKSLPFTYLILDLLENMTVVILLLRFPENHDFLGSYIGYITVGKRVFMLGALFVPLAFLVGMKISINQNKTKSK